jgi:hypothetical protein
MIPFEKNLIGNLCPCKLMLGNVAARSSRAIGTLSKKTKGIEMSDQKISFETKPHRLASHVIKVGTLEIEVNERGETEVRLGGREIDSRDLTDASSLSKRIGIA